jgi:hypothetical protein
MPAPATYHQHERGWVELPRFRGRVCAFRIKPLTWSRAAHEAHGAAALPLRYRGLMTVFAFDVDDTLEISDGPVPLDALAALRQEGHVVGLCGNWALVVQRVANWPRFVSFLGPIACSKVEHLLELKKYLPADEYVMVGNDPAICGNSPDRDAAAQAGWRFLREAEFAAGMR